MPAESPLPFTVIILAAQRAGRLDPLAAAAGVTHKCLVPILGRPLIQYVLEGLAPARGLKRIRICIEPEAIEAVRAVPGASGELGVPVDFVASEPTLTESAYASAEGLEGALLFTTADNVNVTPQAVEQVMAAIAAGADGALALASREAVLAAREEPPSADNTRVGPYRFADGRFSNCNLYAMVGPQVLEFAEAFRQGGQFSKKMRRLIGFVGPFNILLYTLRVLTLEQAMRRLSKRLRRKVVAVLLDDGAQAVDVDNPRSYRAAETILRKRRPQPA